MRMNGKVKKSVCLFHLSVIYIGKKKVVHFHFFFHMNYDFLFSGQNSKLYNLKPDQ